MKKGLIKTVRIFLLSLLSLIIIGLVVVKIFYGTGKPYPDIGKENTEGKNHLEKLITLDYPPGNLAVSENGHVYFNYHPLARANRFAKATLFEWADGKATPFPSQEIQKDFQGSFGMNIDRQNHLWLIEPATVDFRHTRVWAFDLATKQKTYYYKFPEGEAKNSQELRVTGDGKYILLANPGMFRFTNSQLLVFSVENHSLTTAIDGDPSVQPENWVMHTNAGKPYRIMYGLLNFAIGIDGIEISKDQQWVYIASMTHSHLYRVPLNDVLNVKLSAKEVAEKIENLGAKPLSDGITIDTSGNVIITDVEHGGLMSFNPVTKQITTLVRSKEILWPDGVGTGPDNSLYFTNSSIPTYMGEFGTPPGEQLLVKNRPYYIYRLKR